MLFNPLAILFDDAAAQAAPTPSLISSLGFLNIIMLVTSIYVLYGGIKGNGKLYDTSTVKEGQEEEYCKLLRKAYISLGALMLINSLAGIAQDYIYPNGATVPSRELGVFSFYTPLAAKIIQYVTWGVVILAFVLLILIMRKFTDKEAAAKKAQEAAEQAKKDRQYGHTLPVDAFEFDEEEEAEEGTGPVQDDGAAEECAETVEPGEEA